MNKLIIISLLALAGGCVNQAASNKAAPGALVTGIELPEVTTAAASNAENHPPKAVAMRNPVYPYELRKAGVTGIVVVDFVVGIDGHAHDVRIVSSPDPRFEVAVLAASVDWLFEPGVKDGRPVNVRIRTPITFAL